jgi:DNA-binding NarL/FixJ family response regulator
MPRKNRPANSPPAKVLIVDDHPAVREALAIRIGRSEDLAVCGEATGEAEAIRLTRTLKPDVAIIDLSLKSGDGINLIKRIKGRHPGVRMLVWSMHSEGLFAERALRAGASGYITKEHATDRIVDAVRQVLGGRIYVSPAMNEKLLRRVAGPPSRGPVVEGLSDRELEVLRAIGRGQTTREIAARLFLSAKTVSTYRDRVRRKLDLESGQYLVRFAVQWVLENG